MWCGIHWWLKESTCQCRRHKGLWFNPWVRKIPWKRKWQPTPVFLPGKSHGQRSLAGHSPWGPQKSQTRTTAQWLAHSRHRVNGSCYQQSREVCLHLGRHGPGSGRDTGPPANSRFAQCQGFFQPALLWLLGTVCPCAKKSHSCLTGPERKTQELKLGGHREGLLVGLPPREPAAGESPF